MYSYAEERHPTLYMGCTLAPPGEYYWTARLRRRCGLMSNYFDHLFISFQTWFHGSVLNLFKSYLSSRLFRVRCNNTFSSFYTSSCGIPQGSVLGPLLFIMFATPSALFSPLFPLTITFIQTTPNYFSHFTHPTSTQVSPPAKCPSVNLFLDDCQSLNSQFLQDWILTHRTTKATWQDTQLLP